MTGVEEAADLRVRGRAGGEAGGPPTMWGHGGSPTPAGPRLAGNTPRTRRPALGPGISYFVVGTVFAAHFHLQVVHRGSAGRSGRVEEKTRLAAGVRAVGSGPDNGRTAPSTLIQSALDQNNTLRIQNYFTNPPTQQTKFGKQ
ncbi:hypothetical protein AAG570_002669 [Ranatra chinensis]|uniref:Uncharacterized protein n=1 Tax=Ranatra chinensis TaxID=642074 RepID=A0ABD0YUX6_9HEMI